jgi:hypothetical protein
MNDEQFNQLHEVLTRIADSLDDVENAIHGIHDSRYFYAAMSLLTVSKEKHEDYDAASKEVIAARAWDMADKLIDMENA